MQAADGKFYLTPIKKAFWNAIKTKLNAEGSELSQKLGQLKMQSADGKFYLTYVTIYGTAFQAYQSIPSLHTYVQV